jgi:DNA polymerase lambda
MGRLKGKKDLQTLTKHFEAFEKGVAKDNAAERSGATDRKGKGKARSAGKVGLGLGSKVFDGLRFCISPEIGAVSKHKTWWDIVSSSQAYSDRDRTVTRRRSDLS